MGFGLVLSCSSAPPPKPRPQARVVEEVPEPQSAEWLYATKGLSSADLGRECEHVRGVVADEAQCVGEACLYGSRLSADWVRRCRKVSPAALGEVSQLAREYAQRKAGARVPCLRDIEPILNGGCGDNQSCGELAQAWVTRCSDSARSPLVVRILEARLEQAKHGPRKAKLDKRGCSELSADVLTGAKCDQTFQCQDALAAVSIFRTRCLPVGGLPSISQGMAELSIRVGAGETPKTLATAADSSPLEPAGFSLPLADGSGIVVSVCGERPKDLAAYLLARQQCSSGEVVMLKHHAGSAKDGAKLRVGRLLHASSEAFSKLYPNLLVQGESSARTEAGLGLLKIELGALLGNGAGSAGYDPALGAALIRALAKQAVVLRREGAKAALAEYDVRLIPSFKALAGAKRAAAKRLTKPAEHGQFLRRALKRPFADVDPDGDVSFGTVNAATTLDLGVLLPKATAAYQAELAPFVERITHNPLPAKQQEALQKSVVEAIASCNAAQAVVLANEVDLRECAFSVVCEDETLNDLQTELERAHKASEQGRLQALLASESLDGSPAVPGGSAGCAEQWW